MNIAVRIIKSEECAQCKAYIKELDKIGFEYILYDGDAEKNQTQLDTWHVDEFPVVHIIDKDTGQILHAFGHGRITVFALKMKMEQIKRRKK